MNDVAWWATLDRAWGQISDIFRLCKLPMDSHRYIKDPSAIEIVDGVETNPAPTQNGNTYAQFLWALVTNKAHAELYIHMVNAWDLAPDSPVVKQWQGWSTFCDLLQAYETCFADTDEDEDEDEEDTDGDTGEALDPNEGGASDGAK